MSSTYAGLEAAAGDSAARATSRLHWSSWVGWAAVAWSVTYGLLGIYWSLGGNAFPFGAENDPESVLSVLGWVSTEAAAPVVAVLGIAGAALAAGMAANLGSAIAHRVLPVVGVVIGLALTVVIPDFRLLAAVAYAPLFLVGAPFGRPVGVSYIDALTVPVVNQAVLVLGGLAWIGLSVAYARRGRGACIVCGAGDRTNAASMRTAARWGRRAVAVAVVVPIVYATTRYAWALGVPLGVSEAFLAEGAAGGLWVAGAGLATVALIGAALTTGLVFPWGEVFPRWMPLVGGRRVPPGLAIVPALAVAAVVTSAGLMFIRLALIGYDFGSIGEIGALIPELLWPIWGAALAVAALAYGARRRTQCSTCGRGPTAL